MRAKKSYGQHFLHDRQIAHRIIDALHVTDEDLICEVGPGTGKLTTVLLNRFEATRVVCVEHDRDMVAHLHEKFPELRVLQGDAVHFDWETLVPDAQAGRAVVVGNLPYNVSAPIYFHLLLNHRHRFHHMVLMFQQEVAARLLAEPGTKKYGPPSVITHLLAERSLVAKVPPSAFRPPPKVDSAVVAVQPRSAPLYEVREEDVAHLNQFVHQLFQFRRKTLRNNLKPIVGEDTERILEATKVDGGIRSEKLQPETLVDLWRAVYGTAS